MSLHDRIMNIDSPMMISGARFVIQNDAAKIAKEADTRIAELEQCLREARENLEDWGMYASEYFRDKHGIAEDLAAIDRVLGGGDERQST